MPLSVWSLLSWPCWLRPMPSAGSSACAWTTRASRRLPSRATSGTCERCSRSLGPGRSSASTTISLSPGGAGVRARSAEVGVVHRCREHHAANACTGDARGHRRRRSDAECSSRAANLLGVLRLVGASSTRRRRHVSHGCERALPPGDRSRSRHEDAKYNLELTLLRLRGQLAPRDTGGGNPGRYGLQGSGAVAGSGYYRAGGCLVPDPAGRARWRSSRSFRWRRFRRVVAAAGSLPAPLGSRGSLLGIGLAVTAVGALVGAAAAQPVVAIAHAPRADGRGVIVLLDMSRSMLASVGPSGRSGSSGRSGTLIARGAPRRARGCLLLHRSDAPAPLSDRRRRALRGHGRQGVGIERPPPVPRPHPGHDARGALGGRDAWLLLPDR